MAALPDPLVTPRTIDELASRVVYSLDELRDVARVSAEAARAPATERAYATAWRDFGAFCARHGLERLPATPDTVACYVADCKLRGHRYATIASRLAAIAVYHGAQGLPKPTSHDVVRAVLKGEKRTLGIAQRQSTALPADDLTAVVRGIATDLRGLRDRAIFLIGYAGALRRSELAALTVDDVVFERGRGVAIYLRRSKTDQEAAGDVVPIAVGSDPETCPMVALQRWLAAAAITSGPIFRRIRRNGLIGQSALSGHAIATIVSERAAAGGLDGNYAGHSLRSGFATTAARAGSSERAIMRHGRWKTVASARRYIRDGAKWDENPSSDLGL